MFHVYKANSRSGDCKKVLAERGESMACHCTDHSDLNALPLASVLKAQKALTKANRRQYDGDDDQDDESDAGDRPSRAGPSQTKAQKVAEMKARLADLQRSKGRNVAAATASYGEAAQLSDEDDEGDDSAPETSGTGHERGGRTVPRGQVAHKRDSKHACVKDLVECTVGLC